MNLQTETQTASQGKRLLDTDPALAEATIAVYKRAQEVLGTSDVVLVLDTTNEFAHLDPCLREELYTTLSSGDKAIFNLDDYAGLKECLSKRAIPKVPHCEAFWFIHIGDHQTCSCIGVTVVPTVAGGVS